MKPFRFRLDTLLRLRQTERQQRRAELAEAYRAGDLLRRQSDLVALEIRDMQQRARIAASPGRVNVDDLLAAHRYESVLKARSQMLGEKDRQVREEIERRRQALVEADRQVRVLEKLRERQAGAHQSHELRQEARQLDELAQQRHPREVS